MGIFGTTKRDVMRAAREYEAVRLNCDDESAAAMFNLFMKIGECPAYGPDTSIDDVMDELWASRD